MFVPVTIPTTTECAKLLGAEHPAVKAWLEAEEAERIARPQAHLDSYRALVQRVQDTRHEVRKAWVTRYDQPQEEGEG